MPVHILFAARPERWAQYEAPLTEALEAAGLDFVLGCDLPADKVEYIVYAPNSDVQDFSVFPKLKAVLSLWAGVEKTVSNPTLNVPFCRMVDAEGLTQGMVEWVCGHVLRHHLGMDAHIVNPAHRWDPVIAPLASERRVTVLGMGALGSACARALRALGFKVTGWSRSEKRISGVGNLWGEGTLARALRGADIVVLLLPETPETVGVLNASSLGLLARGAVVINPGRGPLIVNDDLLAALDSGQLGHATLDVFDVEPLPEGHPFWAHPKVTVTPHIASETRCGPASKVIAENIRRGERGVPFLHEVDRAAGY